MIALAVAALAGGLVALLFRRGAARTIAGAVLSALGGGAADLYVRWVLSPAYPEVRAFRERPVYAVSIFLVFAALAAADHARARRGGPSPSPRSGAPSAPP